jgi:hypothetical protein
VIPEILATRYVSPLREGGSLPGLMEADDLGTYVVKFHGAGQGKKALVAEVVVGELARRLGLRVPELKAIDLLPEIGRYEPDEEVQDLLTASIGRNLGVDFLPGAFGYDGVSHKPSAAEAARILWLDSYVANVDRSWKNPNLLVWHGELWCIDHGAALYFHHGWGVPSADRFAVQPYDAGKHVFIVYADGLPAADEQLSAEVTEGLLADVLRAVPDDWLELGPGREDPGAVRSIYVDHLLRRLEAPRRWLPGVAP